MVISLRRCVGFWWIKTDWGAHTIAEFHAGWPQCSAAGHSFHCSASLRVFMSSLPAADESRQSAALMDGSSAVAVEWDVL